MTEPLHSVEIHLHCTDCVTMSCTTCPRITRTSEVKYLGVVFDSRVQWGKQINLVTMRLRKLIYVFARLNKILPLSLLKMLYFALVQSVLLYGIPAWGGSYPTTLLPIVTTQKQLIRIIAKKGFFEHTEPLFKHLNILKFALLVEMNCIKQILKESSFSTPAHLISTRFHSGKFMTVAFFRTTLGYNSYLAVGVRGFNALPDSLRSELLLRPSKINKILKDHFVKL